MAAVANTIERSDAVVITGNRLPDCADWPDFVAPGSLTALSVAVPPQSRSGPPEEAGRDLALRRMRSAQSQNTNV